MHHNIRLKNKERIRAYFALSEFIWKLLESNLSDREFKRRLKKNREEHLKKDYLLLSKLGKLR